MGCQLEYQVFYSLLSSTFFSLMIDESTDIAVVKELVMYTTHCVAHRLGLAAAESGDRVHFIRYMFKPTLAQLFKFYENNAIWTAGLKSIEQLFETPELKLKWPADTLAFTWSCMSNSSKGATSGHYKLGARSYWERWCLGSWFVQSSQEIPIHCYSVHDVQRASCGVSPQPHFTVSRYWPIYCTCT